MPKSTKNHCLVFFFVMFSGNVAKTNIETFDSHKNWMGVGGVEPHIRVLVLFKIYSVVYRNANVDTKIVKVSDPCFHKSRGLSFIKFKLCDGHEWGLSTYNYVYIYIKT